MHYFTTDGSQIEPDNTHFNSLVREQTQIEIVKKLAFLLAEESEQIWHLGDGYGGYVKNILEVTFENLGLQTEPQTSPNKTNRKSISQGKRREVYERDEYCCVTCGARKDLSVDHIIPVVKGGTNDIHNLQTMCMPCNLKKGTK
jgi:5-methylcytosine-specific restriction protein A